MPLYPTEKIIWDENIVPTEYYSGEGMISSSVNAAIKKGILMYSVNSVQETYTRYFGIFQYLTVRSGIS